MITHQSEHRFFSASLLLAAAWTAATTSEAVSAPPASPWTISGDSFQVSFDGDHGSILAVQAGPERESIFHSKQSGLWTARFQDGSELHAADFAATQDAPLRFRVEQPNRDSLRFLYSSAQLDVTVAIDRREDGLQFAATVQPKRGTVLQFALPGRLGFSATSLERFICPANGNQSVGSAFLPAFFAEQPADSAASWEPQPVGARGYNTLFGGYLPTAPELEHPVALSVTAAGRACFGGPLADRLEATLTTVNRPGDPNRADLVLIDSPNGPYFYAQRLNEGGRLWRIGGRVERDADQRQNALGIVGLTLEQLVGKKEDGRRSRIGLIGLQPGPDRGSWTDLSVQDWIETLDKLPTVRSGTAEVVRLVSPDALTEALAAGDYLAIVNPYGERLPMSADIQYDAQIEAIRQYVVAGGNWFETGGYPFFEVLRPLAHHYRYEVDYPPAFADFFHWQTTAGTASLYRVAPRTWEPWAADSDPSSIFTPGRLACGGDSEGPWCERPFVTHVSSGSSWDAPSVRLRLGNSARHDLDCYSRDNGLERTLDEKLPSDLLDKFRKAVLVKYEGKCRELLQYMDRLPQPSLIHITSYLHGGFDRQYPDHLPPHTDFGTPDELRRLGDMARAGGHLLMPYTNPTWWCDEPKGPTFLAQGDAPLLRNLDGTLSAERYGDNTGFTICHWHPAARAANRRTLTQFTEDYPVDIVFQDQCGARGFRYDTNPASPTPLAYTEGLLSMVAEDSRTAALSTESGWDQVTPYQVQLCGLSWTIVPTEGGPSWRRLMKYEYPPNTWEIFPLAQYLAHDQAAMLGHDLGQFVTNREVLSWTLALGFSMSYRLRASSLDQPGHRQWLAWLDRVQHSVCARYVGQPLIDFQHQRPTPATLDDDGLIRAQYGDVTIHANVGPRPRRITGLEVAPLGFLARAPDTLAANLHSVGDLEFGESGLSFVIQLNPRGAEAWIYAQADEEVAVLLPRHTPRGLELTIADQEQTAVCQDGVVRFRLPARHPSVPLDSAASNDAYLWHVTLTASDN